MIETTLWYLIGIVVSATVAFSLYGVARARHIVKKLVFFAILGDAAYVLLVYLGYTLNSRLPPVYPGGSLLNPAFPNSTSLREFEKLSVDPVPQVLIITAIVIGLAVFILAATVAIRYAETTGSLILGKGGADE